MQVTGKHHPFSTPESRMRKRDQAERIGDLERFLSAPPFKILACMVALGAAGFVENIRIPL